MHITHQCITYPPPPPTPQVLLNLLLSITAGWYYTLTAFGIAAFIYKYVEYKGLRSACGAPYCARGRTGHRGYAALVAPPIVLGGGRDICGLRVTLQCCVALGSLFLSLMNIRTFRRDVFAFVNNYGYICWKCVHILHCTLYTVYCTRIKSLNRTIKYAII